MKSAALARVGDTVRQGTIEHKPTRFAVAAFAVVLGLAVTFYAAPLVPFGLVGAVTGLLVGIALVVIGLRNPVWAFVFLIVSMFVRAALPKFLPTDPFLFAFAGLIVSTIFWVAAQPERRIRFGAVELTMALYVLWNIHSILTPHEYRPIIYPLTEETLSVTRYLLIGTAIPFATYVISRAIFNTERAMRILIAAILGCSAYSAWVSILQFHGPRALVWPRYIVDTPGWEGRANGLPNQPEVNGLILTVGFVLALVLLGMKDQPRWRKPIYVAITAACGYGVFLTHTRAIWLGFAVIIIMGLVLAKGYRAGFVITTLGVVGYIVMNWSTFTSADRDAGGVGSTNEVFDRLNAAATALWAFSEKPFTGWGLGRFVSVNTYHHQQWSPQTKWERGLGIPAHLNELGILAELGLIGLLLWLTVLFLVSKKLLSSYRSLPERGILGRPVGFAALTAFVSIVLAGLFVDLRMFDYPSTMVMALVGATVGTAERLTRPYELPPDPLRPLRKTPL
ncbi:O-antigen ligase family protein [Antrihabitans spumae]|uniref:O-antigen ligase family protein n=1 Tax=Antrihabitans spumae TaxID=3373370 RepID=A0ABW7KDB6_9NOCA